MLRKLIRKGKHLLQFPPLILQGCNIKVLAIQHNRAVFDSNQICKINTSVHVQIAKQIYTCIHIENVVQKVYYK